MSPLKILAIPGSLRRASLNRALARATAELAPAGVTVEVADLRGIPFYDGDVDAAGAPASVVALKQSIAEADAVFVATPEYNYSVPGVLKNAIDWTSRGPNQPWKGKPVAIAGASPGGFGTVRAQADLRAILGCLDAEVVRRPELYVSRAVGKFDPEGRLVDEGTRETLRKLLESLVASVKDARPA